jgi:hypothetical protein
MDKLQKWKEKFDGLKYDQTDIIYECMDELKNDNVVIAFGASDDLFELVGALNEEYDCFYNVQLNWFSDSNAFVSSSRIDELLNYVEDEFYDLYDTIEKVINNSRHKCLPYITIKHPQGVQFEYETNIPCIWFNIFDVNSLLEIKEKDNE